MVSWAHENVTLSGIKEGNVRYIVDDVIKFVKREIKRGKKYDAIVMDPPVYGRGPSGELWEIEKELFNLIELTMQCLSDKPLFFLINCYTTGLSPLALGNIAKTTLGKLNKGKLSLGELGLPITLSDMILPCGIYCRWEI